MTRPADTPAVWYRNAAWLLLALVVLALDQYTKLLAGTYLPLHRPQALLPFLNLTLTYNTGVAFSLFGEGGDWQRWTFSLLAVGVSAALAVWLLRLPAGQARLAAALALIIGGALGNFWDRATLGYVVDFIDVYYRDWHWPAFNVADSAICIGAALLILDSFKRTPD